MPHAVLVEPDASPERWIQPLVNSGLVTDNLIFLAGRFGTGLRAARLEQPPDAGNGFGYAAVAVLKDVGALRCCLGHT